MSVRETISQVLSNTNATYVNGVSVERNFSPAILKALYQALVETGGKGINDNFVTEDLANRSGQVFVNRLKPIKADPREHGSYKNGGAWSNNGHFSETETVGIDILTLVDDPIYLPRVTQDRIPLDLLVGQTENFVNYIAAVINGITVAEKLRATWVADIEGKPVNYKKITSSDISNKIVLQRYEEANSLLDEGDEAHGIDVFPTDSRIAVFKMSYRPILKATGVLVIGGANYGYEIAEKGGVSLGANVRTADDGFWGVVDGVEVHGISNESLRQGSKFLGFTANELKEGDFIGYISSSYANARGVSTIDQTKVVDSVAGQGKILQPLVKIGCAAWFPLGNVILSKADYNPFKDLQTIFSGVTGISYKVKGAGSRYYSDDAAVSAITTAKFTASATCKDDFNTEHLKGAAYVVADAGCISISEFIAAYNTVGAEKGTFTSGTEKSFSATQTSGKYLTCLFIADDGSCTLVSKVI